MASRRLLAEDGTPVVTKTFVRKPESVSSARQFVHTALWDWKMADLADTAELIVSELASNAVLHARRDSFRVTLRRLADDQVRVAVIDRSRTRPTLADPSDDEDHGRGLAIVDALSHRWGTDPLAWGKCVWAELAVPPPPELPAPRVLIYGSARAQVVYVLVLLAVTASVITALIAEA